MPISPHGMAIAGLQLLAVIGAVYLATRYPTKRWIVFAALLVEYAILRVQPIRMGSDGFAYSLGIFDTVTAAGLLLVATLPRWHRNAA